MTEPTRASAHFQAEVKVSLKPRENLPDLLRLPKIRGLSVTGHFIDESGREIRHWQTVLTSFCRRWESNERWRVSSSETDEPIEI
jgi:hypothetical protein